MNVGADVAAEVVDDVAGAAGDGDPKEKAGHGDPKEEPVDIVVDPKPAPNDPKAPVDDP